MSRASAITGTGWSHFLGEAQVMTPTRLSSTLTKCGQRSVSTMARRFYRAYRGGKIRLGHSLVKRFFGLWLRQEQEVCLRSGLKLRLDMSKANQAGIFWHDGDADVPLGW